MVSHGKWIYIYIEVRNGCHGNDRNGARGTQRDIVKGGIKAEENEGRDVSQAHWKAEGDE